MTDTPTDSPPARPARRLRPRGVKRIVQALTSSGVGIARVEIDNTGKITIIAATAPAEAAQDDLEREFANWEARHGQG